VPDVQVALEAECVALLCTESLGVDGADYCRGYAILIVGVHRTRPNCSPSSEDHQHSPGVVMLTAI